MENPDNPNSLHTEYFLRFEHRAPTQEELAKFEMALERQRSNTWTEAIVVIFWTALVVTIVCSILTWCKGASDL